MGENKTTNLEDTSLIAFMMLKGHEVKEWRDTKNPDRISFDILGDPASVAEDMRKYYANEQVGILDYVKCYKAVKSRMYSFKSLNNKQ